MRSNDMDRFKEVLASSKHIIAVAGAGLSAASGIPTFRGAGGFWRKFDAISLATPYAFRANPSRVWQFYHYRREKVLAASPNAAHYALARFSMEQFRNTVAPGSTFTLITQNVDGLSRRALDEVLSQTQSASPAETTQPYVLEMHGRLMEVLCTSQQCMHRENNISSPICPALAGTEQILELADRQEPEIPVEDLPRCSKCGSLARPGVVWFEERPWHLDEIGELVQKADLCLVVGTSSTVQPAGSYAFEVSNNGGKVAVFNLERSFGDDNADFLFLGPCEETLPEALGMTTTA